MIHIQHKPYILDEHCPRLLKMLERAFPCGCCPASSDFEGHNNNFTEWENDQCDVCREFVNINIPDAWTCPCLLLGKHECIKRTWIALEEKGYI